MVFKNGEIDMKKLLIILGLLTLATEFAQADQYVNGYWKQNGTYVQGYYKTTPNYTPYDNYSTRGNQNPYTGKYGTVDPYRQPSSYMPSSSLNLNTKNNSLRW